MEQRFGTGDGPYSLTIADFNSDGFSDLATANVGSSDVSILLNQMESEILLGDINLDGVVDLLDVVRFVARLIAGEFQVEADINGDGVVDLLDIVPFVELLSG